jgi:hypothetical protein
MSVAIDCTVELTPAPIAVTLLPSSGVAIDCSVDLVPTPIAVTLLSSSTNAAINCSVDLAPTPIAVRLLPSSTIDVALYSGPEIDVNYGHQGVQGPPGPMGPQGPVGISQSVFGETPVGAINGTNLSYTSARPYSPGLLAVYLNGLRLRHSNDYTETGSQSFQFISAPLAGDSLSIDYIQPS